MPGIAETIQYITWDVFIVGIFSFIIILYGLSIVFEDQSIGTKLLRNVLPEKPSSNASILQAVTGYFGNFAGHSLSISILVVFFFWSGAVVSSLANAWMDEDGWVHGWLNSPYIYRIENREPEKPPDFNSFGTDNKIRVSSFYDLYQNYSSKELQPVQNATEVVNLYYEIKAEYWTREEWDTRFGTLEMRSEITRLWALLAFYLFLCAFIRVLVSLTLLIKNGFRTETTPLRKSFALVLVFAALYQAGYFSWVEYRKDIHRSVIGEFKIRNYHYDPLSKAFVQIRLKDEETAAQENKTR